MGSAESKVAAQPLAVVASADGTTASHGPGRALPSRPTTPRWTCTLLRKQNKTAPAITSHPPMTPRSSPTNEVPREASTTSPPSIASSGPSVRILPTTNTVIPLQQLSMDELSMQLLKAVKNGDQRRVEHVVAVATTKHGAIVNMRGMWESTPLIYACQYCHEAIAVWLLEHGADVHLVNEKGVSALLLASLEGMATATQHMLERFDATASKDNQQQPQPPIDAHVGMVYNSVADVNVRASPLLAASMNGHDAVVKLLLQHGADVNLGVPLLSTDGQSKTGGTSAGVLQYPLLAAAKYGHAAVTQMLIEHGADVGVMDANENHTLLLACEAAKEDCALTLLESPGKDHAMWKRPNAHGFTALHYCAMHGLLKAAEWMLQELAWENDSEFLNATTSTRQESAVLVAARKKQIEMVKLLVESGADVMLADRGATTTLDVLKRDKRDEVIQLWEARQAKQRKDDATQAKDLAPSNQAQPPGDTSAQPSEDKTAKQSKITHTTQVDQPEVVGPAKDKPKGKQHQPASASDATADSHCKSMVPLEQIPIGVSSSTGDATAGKEARAVGHGTFSDNLESTESNVTQSEAASGTNEFSNAKPASDATNAHDSVLPQDPPSSAHGCDSEEETQDLTPIVSQKPRGARSKSTALNRRPTGFTLEPKAKARSLSNLMALATTPLEGNGEDEEEEDDAGGNIASEPPTLPIGQTQDEDAEQEIPLEVQAQSEIANGSEAAQVSPGKPKKKKRQAKKISAPKKVKTVISPHELAEITTAPLLPSVCITESVADAGALDDDF